MRRRDFITLVGGAAAAWPPSAKAQQRAVPVVGVLYGGTVDQFGEFAEAFRRGLSEAGYSESRNIAFEYRWAEGHVERLQALADDLVDRRVAVIFAAGGSAPTVAAKKATSTIPIVFSSGGDPVNLGLISSLRHPGGNLTGVSFLANALAAKRLEILHEAVPQAKAIGLLVNSGNPSAQAEVQDVQSSASKIGIRLVIANVSKQEDIVGAFANLRQQHVGAVMTTADVFLDGQRKGIIALAAQDALPAISHLRHYATDGGLMSYGTSLLDAQRLAGNYVGRILKGESRAELPVQQSVKVELVLNLKTAKALGLALPLPLLGRADEVIE